MAMATLGKKIISIIYVSFWKEISYKNHGLDGLYSLKEEEIFNSKILWSFSKKYQWYGMLLQEK